MSIKTIAVIGLGSIGRRHVRNIIGLGYNVIGFDPSEATYNIVEKEFKDSIHFEQSEAEAIKKADAVIIASPHKYHLLTMKNCINANKSVLVEKPIATEIANLEKILFDAKKQKLVIACGFNLRFRTIVEKARELLGGLGSLYWARFICASYLPDWRPNSNYLENYTNDNKDGGIIFDIAHELDLAQFLLGKATVVSSYSENSGLLNLQAEDRASISLKHEAGALSNVYLDYTTRPRQRGFEICGEFGIMKVDLAAHTLKVYDRDMQVTNELIIDDYDANTEYICELKDFISSIQEGKIPRCDGEAGKHNLENILQARKLAGLV